MVKKTRKQIKGKNEQRNKKVIKMKMKNKQEQYKTKI